MSYTPLRDAAESAVKDTYTSVGQRVWWEHHDKQTPAEQERLQRAIVAASEGNYA